MTRTTTELIGACILTLLVVVGYGVWRHKVITESVHSAFLASEIAAKEAAIQEGASRHSTLIGIQEDEAVVQGYFVSEDRVPAFINDLEARARAQGAQVVVSAVAKTGTDVAATLTLALTVKGTFDTVMRTVGTIEYAPYDITISSLVLTQIAKESWNADVRLSVGSPPALPTP